MSYKEDIMQSLTYALRDSSGLKYALKEFNSNKELILRLTEAIEKQNALKEKELAILESIKLKSNPSEPITCECRIRK